VDYRIFDRRRKSLGTSYEKHRSGQQCSPPLTVKNLHSPHRLTQGFYQGVFTGQGEAVSKRHNVCLYDNHTTLILFKFINKVLADPNGRAV